jgi:hypothetical protein
MFMLMRLWFPTTKNRRKDLVQSTPTSINKPVTFIEKYPKIFPIDLS